MTIHFQRFTVLLFFFGGVFFALNSQVYASALPPQADYYRSQGLTQQEKGNYQDALNLYLKALTLEPENSELYNDIGIVYEQLGYPSRAEQYYLRILKNDRDYLPAYSNLAYLYLGQNQIEKAQQFFLERLNRAPENDPWRVKIRKELYRIDPSFKKTAIDRELEGMSLQLAQEADRKAKEEFTVAVERAEMHFNRGQQFLMAKNYVQAVCEFDHALRLTPDNPKVLKAKQRAQYEERIDEVKQRISTATERLNTGEVDSAKEEFQHILSIIPDDASALSP